MGRGHTGFLPDESGRACDGIGLLSRQNTEVCTCRNAKGDHGACMRRQMAKSAS